MSYFPNYPQQPNAYPQPMDQLMQMRQQQYPYQYPQAPQPQQQSGMVWVRNRMEADNYPVAPNTAIALWDASGPYVHRKEADVSGRPIVTSYRLVEVTDVPQLQNNPAGDFVTRGEFQAFIESLNVGRYQKKNADKEESNG